MSRSITTAVLFLGVLWNTTPVDAAGILLVGDTVEIEGTNAEDNASVVYINEMGGAISRTPTDWVRVSLVNLGLSEDYPVVDVSLVTFDALARDDLFRNQTAIPSVADGGPGDDLLIGGHSTDDFFGGTGSDRLVGRRGNDVLAGGDDADVISGGPGFDFMTGGDGNDFLDGGWDDDSCFGGNGEDRIRCGAGDDIADGGNGQDLIEGDEGRDLLVGGMGRDEINGGVDEDLVIGSHVTFPLVHQSLNAIWLEWTSNHIFGRRARNVLGFPHPQFDQRLNGDEFLFCGITVGNDGALDTIDSLDGDRDLCLIDAFDVLVSDPMDIEFCD